MKATRELPGHELYYFATCPYCLVVRMAMWWMGIKLPLKDIMLHPDNHAALVAGGGKGQVPCLHIEEENGSDRWLYESADIIRYLRSKAS